MGVACLELRGENFLGWLKNREIRENLLPQKFPAIRYVAGNFGNQFSVVFINSAIRILSAIGTTIILCSKN